MKSDVFLKESEVGSRFDQYECYLSVEYGMRSSAERDEVERCGPGSARCMVNNMSIFLHEIRVTVNEFLKSTTL